MRKKNARMIGWMKLALALACLAPASSFAMSKGRLGASAEAPETVKQQLGKVELGEAKIDLTPRTTLDFESDSQPVAYTLIRTAKSPAVVTLRWDHYSGSHDSCSRYETQRVTSRDSSCGTETVYEHSCREERTCRETPVPKPDGTTEIQNLCETRQLCGDFPTTANRTCEHSEDVCVDWDTVRETSSHSLEITFDKSTRLTQSSTEEYELVLLNGGDAVLRGVDTVLPYHYKVKKSEYYDSTRRITVRK